VARSPYPRLALRVVGAAGIGLGIFVAGAFTLVILGDVEYTEGFVDGWFGLTAAAFAVALVLLVREWQRDLRRHATFAPLARTGTVVVAVLVPVAAVAAFVGTQATGRSPVDLVAPRISGVARVGNLVRVSPGRWDPRGAKRLSFLIKWSSCRGGTCKTFETEGLGYRLTQNDVGARISAQVIAQGDLNSVADTGETAVVRP
jgi:hypothetical protein